MRPTWRRRSRGRWRGSTGRCRGSKISRSRASGASNQAPARSLLFHALASPNVFDDGSGSTLGAFPTRPSWRRSRTTSSASRPDARRGTWLGQWAPAGSGRLRARVSPGAGNRPRQACRFLLRAHRPRPHGHHGGVLRPAKRDFLPGKADDPFAFPVQPVATRRSWRSSARAIRTPSVPCAPRTTIARGASGCRCTSSSAVRVSARARPRRLAFREPHQREVAALSPSAQHRGLQHGMGRAGDRPVSVRDSRRGAGVTLARSRSRIRLGDAAASSARRAGRTRRWAADVLLLAGARGHQGHPLLLVAAIARAPTVRAARSRPDAGPAGEHPPPTPTSSAISPR